jgi:hypothetical protein
MGCDGFETSMSTGQSIREVFGRVADQLTFAPAVTVGRSTLIRQKNQQQRIEQGFINSLKSISFGI